MNEDERVRAMRAVEWEIDDLTAEIGRKLSRREDLVEERATLRGDEAVWSSGEELGRQVITELKLEFLKIDTAKFAGERPRDETAFWTNVSTVKTIVAEIILAMTLDIEKKAKAKC